MNEPGMWPGPYSPPRTMNASSATTRRVVQSGSWRSRWTAPASQNASSPAVAMASPAARTDQRGSASRSTSKATHLCSISSAACQRRRSCITGWTSSRSGRARARSANIAVKCSSATVTARRRIGGVSDSSRAACFS